jgi:hypothetical protein
MTDEQRQEIMRRQAEGMRAMSDAEMVIRAAEQAHGARNSWPDLTPEQLAQASQNWWAQCRGELPVEPVRTPDRRTLWSRVDWWFREGDEAIVAALVGAAFAPICILLLEVWKWLRLI